MTEFSSDNQPDHDRSETRKRAWTFKRTLEKVMAGDALGTNDRVPLYERVARAHAAKAIDGDMPAIKELYDRVDGKLTDKVEATGKDGAPLVPDIDPTELARRIALILTKPGGTP